MRVTDTSDAATARTNHTIEAATWLASRPFHQRPHPIVPQLRKLFGLTTTEACAAIREANLRHARST